jgi:EAL domain-containing protein (putative c-di-GMP-specific phosphodiesterase class I)
MSSNTAFAGQPTASQESLLHAYLQQLERSPLGWRAVRLNLSRLHNQNRRDSRLRIAGNTFEGLVQQFEGQLFPLQNGDLIYVCCDVSAEQMDEAITRVRQLFSDDPLALSDLGDSFCDWYNLEDKQQFQEFQITAAELSQEERNRQLRIKQQASQWGGGGSRTAITPAQLGKLEEFLQNADLSSFLRRQEVCAIVGDVPPKRIFKELYVSIGELTETVLPGVDLAANRWLFQHLTGTLDLRVLKLLIRSDDSDLHASCSINLNISTLLSSDFLEFDSQLRAGSRGTIIIELQPMDVFADLAEFAFVREFLHEKGYRICLDGILPGALPFIDRATLGIDLVKVYWNSDLASAGKESGTTNTISQAIERTEAARIVLAHCDSNDAIQFGQAAGVTMFQGRAIDSLLQTRARVARRA